MLDTNKASIMCVIQEATFGNEPHCMALRANDNSQEVSILCVNKFMRCRCTLPYSYRHFRVASPSSLEACF